jgi:chemotaxis protein CheX
MNCTYREEIEQVVQSIFSSMLSMDAWPDVGGVPRDCLALSTSIRFRGATVGRVVLGFEAETAKACAATFLGMAVDQVNEDNEREVATELVNMVGGNLKSLLAGPSRLSLPTIEAIFPGAGPDNGEHQIVEEICLACHAGRLCVALYIERIEQRCAGDELALLA